MLKYKNLIDAFRGLYVPKKLVALFSFYNKVANENSFSNGFSFYIDERRNLLKKYSENENFLNSIYEFASADTCGAIYGFWLIDDTCSLDDAPIVIFGGSYEGGHVVSNCFDDFLKVISHEAEPSFYWGDLFFYYDPYDPYEEPLEKYEILIRDQYLNWLKKEYTICPVNHDVDRIIDEAKLKHGTQFSDWLKSFNIESKEERRDKQKDELSKYPTRSPPTSQEATEQLEVIRSIEMIKDKEIKKYIEKNPPKDELGKFGLPQDKYRYGFYGSSSMELDTWRKGEKK